MCAGEEQSRQASNQRTHSHISAKIRHSLVALCPVVSRSSLSENKVVGAEDLAVGASTNGVHGSRLKIHEHSAGNIATASCLIEVNVDALKLEIRVAMVGTSGINTYTQQNQATGRQTQDGSWRISRLQGSPWRVGIFFQRQWDRQRKKSPKSHEMLAGIRMRGILGRTDPTRSRLRISTKREHANSNSSAKQGILTVLVGDNLPELGTDLVTALSSLNVNDFTHCRSP